MRNEFKFLEISYSDLTESGSKQLFTLRKKTFHDRLNWKVSCHDNQEYDEYDNFNTTYIVGFYREELMCSIRMIEIRKPNMITGVFAEYFPGVKLPDKNCLEASRFFVDKSSVYDMGLHDLPVSHMLFLSIINYSMRLRYEGIYAIVSRQMYTILRRSGWGPEVIMERMSEKNERIYLIFLQTDKESRNHFIEKLSENPGIKGQMLYEWPLIFTVQ